MGLECCFNVVCVHGSTNGTNGIPISFKVKLMVPMVIPLVPMVMPMVPFALPMVVLVPLVSQWCHWVPMVPLVKLPMVPFSFFLSFFLSILSRSNYDHHLRCGGWLNFEFS